MCSSIIVLMVLIWAIFTLGPGLAALFFIGFILWVLWGAILVPIFQYLSGEYDDWYDE